MPPREHIPLTMEDLVKIALIMALIWAVGVAWMRYRRRRGPKLDVNEG